MSDADERGCAVCGDPTAGRHVETCAECAQLIARGARWDYWMAGVS